MHVLFRQDRRSVPRYVIDLPIELRGNGVSFSARTRDLSQQSISVVAPARLGEVTLDARLGFSVVLEHLTNQGPTTVEGTAVLLRVERHGDQVILALRAESLTTAALSASAGPGWASAEDDV